MDQTKIDILTNFYKMHGKQNDSIPSKKELSSGLDIEKNAGIPYLDVTKNLPFSIPYEEMLKEAQALTDCFTLHHQNDHEGWCGLAIKGLTSIHTSPMQFYKPIYPKLDLKEDWTDICKLCPATHSFCNDTLSKYYEGFGKIRFFMLRPGGYIMPHRDQDKDFLGSYHIALNNPDNCIFAMENCGILPFQSGSSMILSLYRKHIVWNRSNENRFFLLVHGTRKANMWNDIIKKSYDGMYL